MGGLLRVVGGREAELSGLRSLLREAADGAGNASRRPAIAISGRRASGKSTLLQEACRSERLPSLFFTARRDESSERALERFVKELGEEERRLWPVGLTSLPLPASTGALLAPTSWREALTLALTTLREAGRESGGACLAIDELPWLIANEPEIEACIGAALEAAGADRGSQCPGGGAGAGERPGVALALLGADMHAMRSLSEEGRPLQELLHLLQLDPLHPSQLRESIGGSAERALDAWCAIGGLPQLLERWRHDDDVISYLSRELLDPTSPLIVEGERFMAAELPPKSAALAVLFALGEGHCDFTAIFNRTRLGRTAISGALHRHALKGNVRRHTPFAAGEEAKLTCYSISDPYLRFWLRFVGPCTPELRRGAGELVLRRVLEGWASFREQAIEPLVRESLLLRLPSAELGDACAVGLHWTRRTQHGPPTIVGARQPLHAGAVAFLGTIAWRDGVPFSEQRASELAALRRRVPFADESALLVGVAREGFERGAKLDVRLGPEELLEAWGTA